MPDQTVISNTSPLFYLHAVGQLDLLRQLFGRIITPPAVVAELAAGVVKGHDVPNIAASALSQQYAQDSQLILSVNGQRISARR